MISRSHQNVTLGIPTPLSSGSTPSFEDDDTSVVDPHLQRLLGRAGLDDQFLVRFDQIRIKRRIDLQLIGAWRQIQLDFSQFVGFAALGSRNVIQRWKSQRCGHF